MRLGVEWNRLYLAGRALVLACLMLALGASSAGAAASLYAVPSGGLTSGGCTTGNECELEYAVETAAASGDTVWLAPGTYAVNSAISAGNITLRGSAAGVRLVGAAGLNAPTLTVSGGSARELRVESSSSFPAISLDGTGDRLQVFATNANAMTLAGGSTLTTSVVHTSAAGAIAVRINGGALTTTTVAHSTIVATGSGSTGLDSSGLLASPSVTNSIVNGTSNDVVGDLLASVSVSYTAYRTALSAYVSGGAGNRNAAAIFVNAGALDFQQASNSPTVNTGNAGTATVDIDGRPRWIGEGPDIGAYELPIKPNATTGTVSNLTGTSVDIGATINPRGSLTTYQVKYGKTSPPTGSTGPTTLDDGTVNLTATKGLTGLTPATRYYYQVVATNEWGDTEGSILTFDTPSVAPVPTTDAATLVTATGARLNGRVNPGGAATDAKFEWGETTGYGSSTSVQSLGAGTSTLSINETLTGLTPNKTYYYRVTATNSNGTVNGLQGSFTTPARAPINTLDAPSGLSTGGATVSGTVDPGGTSTSWQFDYGVGAYDQTASGTNLTGATPQAVSKTLTGLLPGTSYQYRLVSQNSEGTTTTTGTFATQVAPPTAVTGAAGGITARGATVAGTLNPGGDAATYRVEYGTTTSYGETTSSVNVADGTSDVAASRTLSGLEPGTVYHYRLVVTNSAGTAHGTDGTFTTAVALPGVATDRASGVTFTGAQLSGAVNPGGGFTAWRFEYGRTAAYGHSTAATTLTAGNDDEVVAVRVEGLEPGATYHFRLVAQNAAGETLGEDATFTTLPPNPPPSTGDTGNTGDTADTGPAGDEPADPGEPVDDVPVTEERGGATQADGLPVPVETPPVGRAANAAPASGSVQVKLPGTSEFVPLTEGASLPMGSVVDATDGQIRITSAADNKGRTQTANFGGAQFKITQRRAARPITDITLVGGDFGSCFPRVLAKGSSDVFAAGRRKWSRRRLWGNGHGRFRTRGRHGTATVRGTHWLTEDRCDGTLVRVRRGLVEVRDLERRRTVMVGAGEQYLAKSPRAQKARKKKR
jgi:phosphodiesterase/alkaline phosphatase D-like protein